MGGGSGGYTPDTDASLRKAEIAEEQYDAYKRYYRPIEDQAFRYIQDQEQQRADVDEAVKYADTAFDTMQGSKQRNLDRYGVSPSAEAKKNFTADTARSKALAGINAKNKAREAVGQRVDSASEQMVNIGKGVQHGADNTMNSWMQLENLNNQAEAQKKAQDAAARNQMIGTGASLVITAAMLIA